MSAPRKGDWIQTFTGRQYWPTDPRAEEVHIEDIAHALSNLCRYGGHARTFYSVAEHSYHVSFLVEPEHARQALLHDGTEAYCVDVPRPLKRFLTNYKEIEERNWRCIADRFDVPRKMHESVKLADNRILLAEQVALMPNTPADWFPEGASLERPSTDIACWGPPLAEKLFLARFKELS